jgi:hypothetical protein
MSAPTGKRLAGQSVDARGCTSLVRQLLPARNHMFSVSISRVAQKLAKPQNCPAEPALGIDTPAASTELSTAFVDNFT